MGPSELEHGKLVKIAHYVSHSSDVACLGLVFGDRMVDIRAGWPLGVHEIEIGYSASQTLFSNLASGALTSLSERFGEVYPEIVSEWTSLLNQVTLLPPVQPGSFRDYYTFEDHVRSARARRGLEVPPEWYEGPVFYFSNVGAIVGHGTSIRKPPDTNELDFELEAAVVIGKEGANIELDDADDYIAGFTILNDWSARDLQRREMRIGLGPAKGKDFATSIGPWLATSDELAPQLEATHRGWKLNAEMRAFINGNQVSSGNVVDMNWTFAELIVHASRNVTLYPGDLIGSGTVGTGCLLERPAGEMPWLQPGDLVRLEIDGLGALENTIT